MILNYFGNKIYIKEKVEITGIGKGTPFDNSLNNLFASLPIANDPNQNGQAKTTVHLDSNTIISLENSSLLIEKICKEIAIALSILEDYHGEFAITRVWTNRMFENACGSSHIHNSDCNYVALYYYEAPRNCSKFIVNGHTQTDIFDFDLSKNDKLGIEVNNETLIIHPVGVNHSVSKNLTNEHRTVFVFEIKI